MSHAVLDPACLDRCLDETALGPAYGRLMRGKVRDVYVQDGRLLVITTDRISAFDRVLGLIPHKGQVLNQLSAWWFDRTADLVSNHLIAVPDPHAMVARKAEMLPVEVVVRGYITGVTDTSLWTLYSRGERAPYGVPLPDGLRKNDPLPQPVITPTTKAAHGHDEQITPAELIARGVVTQALWEELAAAALALFARGQALAAQAGLALVDTKYEFGLIDGRLTLCDELHTPDSSRYWSAESVGTPAPENYSKEYLREWYARRGYRGDGPPPPMPAELRLATAERYIAVYERLTGCAFAPGDWPAAPRIARHLAPFAAPNALSA